VAPRPMFRPDPSQPPQSADPTALPGRGPEWVEDSSGVYLAELAATLASHGGGASSAALALDLLLNEMVEQARSATDATGAAIALARDNEMVCRATTGVNAPGLGVRLNTRTGLSGACFRTREAQICDDTEIDPRVDTAACRELNVRSIVVVPVLYEQELLGVFEIFSPQPAAFGERDIQILRGLSRRIMENIRGVEDETTPSAQAVEAAFAPAVQADSPPASMSLDELRSEFAAPGILFGGPEPPDTSRRPRDYWTGILTTIVVALALLLGWMVGRVGRQRTAHAQKTPTIATAPVPEPAPAPEAATVPSATVTPAQSAAGETQSHPARKTSVTPASGTVTRKKSGTTALPADGLTVYENGKLIFKTAPEKKSGDSGTELASVRKNEEAAAGESAKTEGPASATPNPVSVSAETASTYLILRVEPDYPEDARTHHIQGPVVLKALVGKDGAVRDVTVVNGDAHLANAATDAVRQWRFRPYRQEGRRVAFETQITVNFTLPQN
jgi:TonB family protein